MSEEFPQSSTITCTYFFLLESWDKNNREDFEISDYDISSKLKINRNTIINNRKILRDLGLINYQITKGFPTLYKIIKGKEVIPVAEKEKVIAKKTVSPALPPIVQEEPTKPVQQTQVQTVLPTVPIEAPKLPPTLPKSKQAAKTPSNIPSIEEFIAYAKTLNTYKEELEEHIRIKYETWKENGWITGYNKPIVNWKQTLRNTMPYLTPNSNNQSIFNVTKLNSIPKINRPKATYNE